jgi:hypothetical protein
VDADSGLDVVERVTDNAVLLEEPTHFFGSRATSGGTNDADG